MKWRELKKTSEVLQAGKQITFLVLICCKNHHCTIIPYDKKSALDWNKWFLEVNPAARVCLFVVTVLSDLSD